MTVKAFQSYYNEYFALVYSLLPCNLATSFSCWFISIFWSAWGHLAFLLWQLYDNTPPHLAFPNPAWESRVAEAAFLSLKQNFYQQPELHEKKCAYQIVLAKVLGIITITLKLFCKTKFHISIWKGLKHTLCDTCKRKQKKPSVLWPNCRNDVYFLDVAGKKILTCLLAAIASTVSQNLLDFYRNIHSLKLNLKSELLHKCSI